jgi:hypothetical protein
MPKTESGNMRAGRETLGEDEMMKAETESRNRGA